MFTAWSGSGDELLLALAAAGLPYCYSAHDMYLACPTVYLIDSRGEYCDATTDNAVCRKCLSGFSALKETDIERWRHRYGNFLDGAGKVFAPSAWARDTLTKYYPRVEVTVAPPWSGLPCPEPAHGVSNGFHLPDDDHRHIGILGAVGPEKGSRHLDRLVARIRERDLPLRLVLVGYTDRVNRHQSSDKVLTIHGRYRSEQIGPLFDCYRIAIVVFPTVWPETFSYTLGETWRAGRPALVPPVGALQERVLATGAGWIMDGWPNPDLLLDQLMAITAPDNRGELERRARLAKPGMHNVHAPADPMSMWYAQMLAEVTRKTGHVVSRAQILEAACQALGIEASGGAGRSRVDAARAGRREWTAPVPVLPRLARPVLFRMIKRWLANGRQAVPMRDSNAARVLLLLLAVAGFAIDVAAYYPGQMSFDSAYVWWQVRGGESSNLQSQLLVQVWRVCNSLVAGPGLIFVLQLLFFWGGLVLIALGLRLRPLAASALMLVVGLAPIAMILRAHVWTDVGMLGALLVVTGAMAMYSRTEQRAWLLLTLPVGFYALSLRHNALPALLPLAVFAVQRFLTRGGRSPTFLRIGTVSALVLAVMFAGVQAINNRVDRHYPLWPAMAEFDLAALSIAGNQVLLPAFSIEDGMDVPDLTQAFRPWAVNALLTGTHHGIRDPYTPGWTESELAALRQAWFAAVAGHPIDYLAHRLAVSAALFGTHRRDWPRELIFVDAEVQFRDNPPVAANTGVLHRWIMQVAETLRDTPALAAWPYLLIGLVAAPFAWRPAGRAARDLRLGIARQCSDAFAAAGPGGAFGRSALSAVAVRRGTGRCSASPCPSGRASPAVRRRLDSPAGRREQALLMATPEYAQWLARGRAHQREGRPVDAMLCYRRATSADPRAPDPHFHLGEVLWQLGRIPDAVAAWREALRVDPGHLAPAQALAEALLATGDAVGAREMADGVLSRLPGDARATMIRGTARLTMDGGATESSPAVEVELALRREPNLAAVATLGGPLALALDYDANIAGRDALLAIVARMDHVLGLAPPLLLALALEHNAGANRRGCGADSHGADRRGPRPRPSAGRPRGIAQDRRRRHCARSPLRLTSLPRTMPRCARVHCPRRCRWRGRGARQVAPCGSSCCGQTDRRLRRFRRPSPRSTRCRTPPLQ